MSSDQAEFIDTNKNYNAMNRMRLQFLAQLEGEPLTPYADEVAAGLIFQAGLIWWANNRKTIQITAESYDGTLETDPEVLNIARHLEIPLSGTSPITISHNLACLPNVQVVDNSTFALLTPTTVTWTTINSITFTFTGTWAAIALVTG